MANILAQTDHKIAVMFLLCLLWCRMVQVACALAATWLQVPTPLTATSAETRKEPCVARRLHKNSNINR